MLLEEGRRVGERVVPISRGIPDERCPEISHCFMKTNGQFRCMQSIEMLNPLSNSSESLVEIFR